MNAVDMIRRCFFYQNPDEHGRALIPYPSTAELGACARREQEYLPLGIVPESLSLWCQRCGCDHGLPVEEVVTP
jgi:hypothetical protein